MEATSAGPFEIVEELVHGIPMKVFRHQPRSLRAIWDLSEAHGDATYLVYGDERVTFADAHRMVRAFAHHLASERGVVQGDRVAIATRNYPEWAIAYWATVALGGVAVPLNAWWTGPELAYGLTDSGAVVLVADDERAERVAPHLAETAVRGTVLVRSDRDVSGGVPFADVIAGDAPPLPPVEIDADDDATIMYTSGTTGRPKGAVQTHRNFGAFLMNGVYRTAMATSATPAVPPESSSSAAAAPAQPATLLTLPLFHVGGLQSFLLPFTASGGKVVLMYKWDAEEAVDLIEREQVTTIAGVPTTVFELLDAAAKKDVTLSSLGGISSGATLVPPELVRRIDEQLQHRTAPGNGYGLTETSGAAIANFGPEYVQRPDSVGRPISPVIEVRVADGDGEPCPAGDVGEIWLKGPTVIRGYFNLPEATAAAFTDGWFRTGDLGYLDAEGFLYVVDRLKDVIIRGGENIYAAEVEAVLYEHPDVVEAAIVGVPHERLGEEVAAVVRVRPGASLGADDVRKLVAGRLAAFKVPTQVEVTTDPLPRNATGKVLKRELRERLDRTT
jgi:steroid-24-oyl-CoA synthetase